jgi:putative Ca2+/H+ antiporter (TMEM165/GDT1 family)
MLVRALAGIVIGTVLGFFLRALLVVLLLGSVVAARMPADASRTQSPAALQAALAAELPPAAQAGS